MLPRTLLTLLAPLALLTAGCIGAPALEDSPVDAAGATDPDEARVLEWEGRVAASALAPLAHQQVTEELLAPVHSEGFGMELTAVPTAFRVDLTWSGDAAFSLMVDVPTEDGAASYASDAVDTGAACMMVPVDGLVTGPLAVMTHSQGAVDVEYTVTVTLVNGDGRILPGGHSAAEPGAAEHEHGLPCAGDAHTHA